MHNQLSDAERDTIKRAAAWLSNALQDERHTASNRTRFLRLFQGGQLELGAFMDLVKRAHSMTIHRMPGLDKPAAYMFRILESLLNEPVKR